MAIGLTDNPQLLPVPGIMLAACSAGIYNKQRPDLALLACDPGSVTAAVFTSNAFCAAPVIIARDHLKKTQPRYLLINAGNANAGTGRQGIADASLVCRQLARQAGCRVAEILPFSTGVIGVPLPVNRINRALPRLMAGLSAKGWSEVARAIMTTDTLAKGISRQIIVSGQKITVTGIVKGSGMIRPDMATMLAFIATDALIKRPLLAAILREAVTSSFNCISVDGDTSTNDACVLIATGKAHTGVISRMREAAAVKLRTAVMEICAYLAQSVIRDGEGATKFLTIEITHGRTRRECQKVAHAIAHSPLVKTALSASDPNWGRIIAAIGNAGLSGLKTDKIRLYLDNVCIFEKGMRAGNYTETVGKAIFSKPEIKMRVDLGRGRAGYQFWTCDLSTEYVRINADYRS